ncbi:PREDICTED: serine/threonine-protein phosphatase 6 regulatory ankyrin repeat subunit C-like [Acropora digitifera]|uniref:serine/threonine-protein phosphatase 6 regulatory ankyrin repeat subunit C-like n=1 Tax=Acropora digitifera TaxID=70779 RepID=UPI00077ABE0A|nr:PREDICTED: serine/threonine-protein phosphatase 6 regulatory ankyrin repeat subunit C-like [Acropora digitifera]
MAIHYEEIDLLNIRLHHEQIRRYPQEGEIVGDGQLIGNNRLHNAVLLSDINACLQEEQCLYVNDTNAKGETPLHLAAINTSQEGVVLTEILLAKGGDVNMKNNWDQTPVLYAAITDSFETLQKLIAAPNIDIDVADLKGYNALHCLLSYRKPPSIEEETYHLEDDEDLEVVSSDLKQALCQFVKTGIKLNCQTNFGNSILHLAARREDNTPLLRFILRNFPEIDLRSKNQMGENFLHVYGDCEIFENVSELLDEIASTSLPVLTELLAEKDIFGRTPWGNMIDDANFSPIILGIQHYIELQEYQWVSLAQD